MSFLSKALHSVEKNVLRPAAHALNYLPKKAEKGLSKIIPHTHTAEREAALQAAKEQIDYYKQAKEDLAETRRQNEADKQEQRKKINEKEIRSRQRTYRRGGFLEEANNEVGDKLG